MSALRADAGPMYKLSILGDGGVGKTALTLQLCRNQFVETYDPTIEDSFRKKVLLDGEPSTLEVLDTAGQEEYAALRDQWIHEAEGFLLVYSITSRDSFLRVKPYYDQIVCVKDGEPFSVVLVGNKLDRTEDRQVAARDGHQLATELGIDFFETSAKLNINTEAAFLRCARRTRDSRNTHEDEPDTRAEPEPYVASSASSDANVPAPDASQDTPAPAPKETSAPARAAVPKVEPASEKKKKKKPCLVC